MTTTTDENVEVAGKERKCLDYVLAHSDKGSPDSVLDAIDRFAKTEAWMMNVGDDKGPIVDNLVKSRSPTTVVEIGGYCGYSAVRFARLLKNTPNARYFSFEVNPEYAEVATKIIAHAGLSSIVTLIVSPFSDGHKQLKEKYGIQNVDVFFIDHWKDLYLSDCKVILGSGLAKKGTLLIADNVIYPGAPDYLEFVRSHPKLKSRMIDTVLEYTDGKRKDGIEVSEIVEAL
ncbi:putative catechol O-methyltransferase [Paraphysoderma sedebokerense]|nr:putative catechol O-methyltransferase [Paraphysoderma sedebokerense]